MASARFQVLIKPEDVVPPPPPPPLTPKEKRQNFWFYYKWHFVIGGVIALILGTMIYDIVTQVRPDYEIGLITTIGYPPDTDVVLSEKLTPFFDDRNGDGEIVVNVNIYSMGELGGVTDPNVLMANQTKFVGDVDAGQSMLFIVDEPALLDAQYGIFSDDVPDDTIEQPEEGDDLITVTYDPADNVKFGVRWGDCPKLTALDLGESVDSLGGPSYSYQLFLEDFRILPRVFYGTHLEGKEKQAAYYTASLAAMEKMTEGAA